MAAHFCAVCLIWAEGNAFHCHACRSCLIGSASNHRCPNGGGPRHCEQGGAQSNVPLALSGSVQLPTPAAFAPPADTIYPGLAEGQPAPQPTYSYQNFQLETPAQPMPPPFNPAALDYL